MTTLDSKLLARRDQIIGELAKVQKAEAPIAESVARRLAEHAAAVEAFERSPFRFNSFVPDGRAPVAMVERMMEGAFGSLFPQAKARIEKAERTRLEARKLLHLDAREKSQRIADLERELRGVEAQIELGRRKIAADGEVLPPVGHPSTWLLPVSALTELGRGVR